jgi:class 3 adenylate cyclase/tetratricopeptide (TPR) repeat protein
MLLPDPDRISILSSYLPRAVLDYIASLPTSPSEPSAESFPAALLLIDITGFTQITTAAIRRGAAGTEQLSRSLNTYLGQIADLITDHGGDIAKIVGDGLIPIWPATDEDLATVTRRAAVCGLEVARRLGELEVEANLRLSLKVGLCAGEIDATHVGGLDGKWLFLITGNGVAQLSVIEEVLQTGDVIASPEAWDLVSERFVGQHLEGGHVRLTANRQEPSLRPLRPLSIPVEKEHSVRAYVPDVLLSRLDAGQAAWLAEFRRTTVVFANVHGIGDVTADTLQLLQGITQQAQRVIGRYGGWLKEITMDDKGTTLVACFGVPPFTHDDDPARAVDAAVALQASFRDLGVTAGVGVATGPTFCGPVGNATRRDFAMLGGHVNLAARLMLASGGDAVLCDAPTHDIARRRREFERLPAFVLKGMTSPTDVYRVPTAASASVDRRIVDRTAERAAAGKAMEALAVGQGELVTVEGEPGIGKSRLADEWLRQAHERGVTTLVGAGSDIDDSTPYHAWRPVFAALLGLDGIKDPATRRTRLLDRLGGNEDHLRLSPLLGPILSVDLPDNDSTAQMTGVVRGDNTRDLLTALIGGEASKGPLMLVIEDAHWLDSASWSLLIQVRREVPSVLLLVTMRPTEEIPADPEGILSVAPTRLLLAPLSPQDAVTLAAERTGAAELAAPVATLVRERAEGNPLFIEQLTYAMRDAGRIVVDHGLLRPAAGAEALDSAPIPDTVQRVITARLDHLTPEQAMTLKVASVIGPRFALRTLQDIYPLPEEADRLLEHLQTLTRLDLVAPVTPAPEPTYEFRHKIAQEVAYELMPPAQSKDLHRALAEWYERAYADDLSPFNAFLAYHWRNAGLPERAVDHLEQAGLQALRTFANDEAIDFLKQALALDAETAVQTSSARKAQWHLQLAQAYVNLSRYREGRDQIEVGLRLMKRPAPATGWQQVLSLLGELARQALRRAGLIRRVRHMTDAERDELVAVSRAYEPLGEVAYYAGEPLLALYVAIRFLNLAEASESSAEMARGFAGTGALLGLVPWPRIAVSYLRRSLAELSRVDDLPTHEFVGIVVGFYYVGAAGWNEAREQFRTVRKIARRLGDRRRLEDSLSNSMELESLQGSFAAGAQLADELIAAASARNDRRFHAEGLVGKGYCALQMGDADTALQSCADFRQIVEDESYLTDELRIKSQGLLALIHLNGGDWAQARAASDEAMRLTRDRPTYAGTFIGYVGPAEVYLEAWERDQPFRDEPRRAAEALARMKRFAGVFPVGRPRWAILEGRRSWLGGSRGRAHRLWRSALATANHLDMPYEQGLAHFEIGRHLEPSDPERAAHLQEAREIFGRIHASRALAAADLAAERDAVPA